MTTEEKQDKLKGKDDTHAVAKRKEMELERVAKALGVNRKLREAWSMFWMAV